MPSYTGSSKRAVGAGNTSAVEGAAFAALRRKSWQREITRSGVPGLGKDTLSEMVAFYGESTIADMAGVKVKVLRKWIRGGVLVPTPARARLHVLRAAEKHLGDAAKRWLIHPEKGGPAPAELLRSGHVDDAWGAFRRARGTEPQHQNS